jgi:hypothetical protein
MGAYNTVEAKLVCPRCKSEVSATIQFKYGDTWQYRYALGDRIRWGGNDIGAPGERKVVVDGIVENQCPICGYGDEWNVYVRIGDDQLRAVDNATGEYDFAKVGKTYIVES